MAVCAHTKDSVCARHIFLWGIYLRSRLVWNQSTLDYHMSLGWRCVRNKTATYAACPPYILPTMQPAQCRFWTEPCNARSLVQAERERKTFWPDVILSWHSRPVVPSYLQALQVPWNRYTKLPSFRRWSHAILSACSPLDMPHQELLISIMITTNLNSPSNNGMSNLSL